MNTTKLNVGDSVIFSISVEGESKVVETDMMVVKELKHGQLELSNGDVVIIGQDGTLKVHKRLPQVVVPYDGIKIGYRMKKVENF